jgi:tRNA pseudouridine38-40 synthase
MFNKKCVVEYDGSLFSGWQVQKGARTVQEEISKVLSKIYKHKISINGAGRTDAKVHAEGQVFNFISNRYIENKYLIIGMNSLLPLDIAVKSIEDVPLTFHARKCAKKKKYSYKIFNREKRSVFYANLSWWIKRELDIFLLEKQLKYYEGTKDFKKYCKCSKVYASTIRTIYSITMEKENDFLIIHLIANGFLRRMVRNIIGTVVLSNFTKESGDNMERHIHSAPPQGLYLKEVFY